MSNQIAPFSADSVLNPLQGGTGYDGTLLQAGLVLVTTGNPQMPFELVSTGELVPPTIKKAAVFTEQYASGTDGTLGAASTYQGRQLNTTTYNTLTGASLNVATGIVTVPAGNYRISARCVSYGFESNQTAIINFNTSVFYAVGLSEGIAATTTNQVVLTSTLDTFIIFAASEELQLFNWVGPDISGVSPLLGKKVSSGQAEVYAMLSIQQL